MENTTENTVKDTVENESNSILIDESKDFAYIKEEKFSVSDIRTGNNVEAVNKIPTLNINTEYAKYINNKIQELYNNKDEKSYIDGYIYEYNDVISIVVSTPNVVMGMLGGGTFNFNVFTIDKNTGNEVYEDEILKTVGLSYDNIYDSIIKFMKEQDDFNTTNQTNLKAEIADNSLKMYINNSGNLCVVFYTLTEFEAGQYNVTYVLDGKDTYESLTYKYNVEIVK